MGPKNRARPGRAGPAVSLAAAFFFAPCFFAPCGRLRGAVEGELAGDCNSDATFDISDVVYEIAFLFTGGETPACRARYDFRPDGVLGDDRRRRNGRSPVRGGDDPVPLAAGVCDETIGIEWDPVTLDILGGEEDVRGYRIYIGNG